MPTAATRSSVVVAPALPTPSAGALSRPVATPSAFFALGAGGCHPPLVETVIATGVTDARNAVAILNGGAVIAVDSGPGALSELGHALTLGKPVTGIDTHRVDSVVWIEHVGTPQRRSTTSKPASEL